MKTGTKIITLDNGYHLWTNTQGEGDIHLLALHGGPGGKHEYWEDTPEQLKKQGLNIYHLLDSPSDRLFYYLVQGHEKDGAAPKQHL